MRAARDEEAALAGEGTEADTILRWSPESGKGSSISLLPVGVLQSLWNVGITPEDHSQLKSWSQS